MSHLYQSLQASRAAASALALRRLSSIGYEERYPNQFLLLGDVKLSAGAHTVRLSRGGGSLHPGSGDAPVETVARTIGAIVLVVRTMFAHDL